MHSFKRESDTSVKKKIRTSRNIENDTHRTLA